MFTKSIFFMITGFGLWVMSANAFAYTDEQITDIIKDKMHERHPNDRASEWTTLGPQTPRLVLRYMQETNSDMERLRLLGVLGNFTGNSEVADFLRERAQSAESPMERSVAIRSLAESQGAQSASFLAPFLSDSHSEVRIAAADSLRRIGGEKEQALVEAQAKNETAPGVGSRMLSSSALPPTPVQLRPVSKLDGQGAAEVAKEWVGRWSGMAVVHEAGAGGKEPSLKSVTVLLNLGFSPDAGWAVEFSASGRKLETAQIRELPAHGGLVASVTGLVSGVSEPFELRFHRDPDQAQLKVLQIEGSRSGSVGLLRRQSGN